jgi:hypothetical protein
MRKLGYLWCSRNSCFLIKHYVSRNGILHLGVYFRITYKCCLVAKHAAGQKSNFAAIVYSFQFREAKLHTYLYAQTRPNRQVADTGDCICSAREVHGLTRLSQLGVCTVVSVPIGRSRGILPLNTAQPPCNTYTCTFTHICLSHWMLFKLWNQHGIVQRLRINIITLNITSVYGDNPLYYLMFA